MTDQPYARGSCQCGEITLTISNRPRMMMQCHCLDCQKSTGTGHTSNAYFSATDVEIQGEAKGHSVVTDSGNQMTRYFCPTCGSRVYGSNSKNPDLVSIQVGCLDDHSWFTPQVVLYTSRQHDWDITADEAERFDHNSG